MIQVNSSWLDASFPLFYFVSLESWLVACSYSKSFPKFCSRWRWISIDWMIHTLDRFTQSQMRWKSAKLCPRIPDNPQESWRGRWILLVWLWLVENYCWLQLSSLWFGSHKPQGSDRIPPLASVSTGRKFDHSKASVGLLKDSTAPSSCSRRGQRIRTRWPTTPPDDKTKGRAQISRQCWRQKKIKPPPSTSDNKKRQSGPTSDCKTQPKISQSSHTVTNHIN